MRKKRDKQRLQSESRRGVIIKRLYLRKVPFPNQDRIAEITKFLDEERKRLYPLLMNARFLKRFRHIPSETQAKSMLKIIKRAKEYFAPSFIKEVEKQMGFIIVIHQKNDAMMKKFHEQLTQDYGRQALNKRRGSSLFYSSILKKTVKDCHGLLNPMFIDPRETTPPANTARAIRMTANLINYYLHPLEVMLSPKDVEEMIRR